MLEWLKRLLTGRPRPEDGDEAPAAASPEQRPGPLPVVPSSPEALTATPEAWAEALGVEVAALAGGEDLLPPEEEALAQAVLAHFDTHRPGPASFPAISLQIYDLARNPEAELARLATLIEMDAALTAGVLVLANSPLYRGVERIETPRQAIARLGTAEVARLATALSTRSLFRPEVRAEFETFGPAWNALFYHSASVARTASSLGAMRRLPGADHAFVGGMLHDVGKSIALRSLAALVIDGKVPLPEGPAISRVLHRVHVEVGSEVHREWQLPAHLTMLAVRHHERTVPADADLGALHLVRLASALQLLRTEPGLHLDAPVEALDSARALKLPPDRVAALRVELGEQGDWVRMLFGDEAGGPAAAR